jgi:ADP-ribose pyrophosphatase YjhB (NUDIX family)
MTDNISETTTQRTVTDPEVLARREGVEVRGKTRSVEAEPFALFERHDGAAVVGITRDDGALLLWRGPKGWTLPFTFVDPDADWVAAAKHVIAELTGVTVDIAGIAAFRRVENTLADGDDSVTSYEVLFRAATVGADTAAELAAFESDDDHPNVEWFEAVPEDCDHVDDVERFLE